MPAISLENACEQICVLMLLANANLSAVSVVREDENADVNKDRIVCKAQPRQQEDSKINPTVTRLWKVPVSISIHLATRSVVTMDTYIASVRAAMDATAPAGAITLATTYGARTIDEANEGDRDNGENVRHWSTTFNVLCEPV